MSYLEQIKEKEGTGFSFHLKHKLLEIPRDLYLSVLDQYENPFSEEAAQYLTQQYLDWKDDHGLLGMIRINDNQTEEIVELDATIRYIVDNEQNISRYK